MLLTYKVEIEPTEKQAWQIDCHIGGSRWAYNLFLDINRQRYELRLLLFECVFL
ncbi:helix-turn-helix domain protein [Secundilactobacillus mixtipabuli]|uniref:Helix-turn-helix domain protein n=2 Tax=Secundilactobacillus mixtipabuli TaxID=1435342 RepID=A0A1Z5I8Z1_9LACO|nr:helix-turn-helix domain protein [Secundilactobacillus mixtipabuli]